MARVKDLGHTVAAIVGTMAKQAVLVIGFNRPDLLHQNFSAICEYQPKKLYFACDGPRDTHPDDNGLVAQARRSVEGFTWRCEIEKRFQNKNLGLRANMVEALDWFFENEPEGIVLEDDCLPTPDFFCLMEHILERYADQPRVWGATGSNLAGAWNGGGASYDFIRCPSIWGWASWANRWTLYDRNLVDYRSSGLAGRKRRWRDPYEYHAFDWHLRQILNKQFLTTWSFQWSWTVSNHDGLWAVPARNLVSNAGFDLDATHTRSSGGLDQSTGALGEIRSPASIVRNHKLQHHIHRKQHRVLRPLWLNYIRNAFRWLKRRWICKRLQLVLQRRLESKHGKESSASAR